MKFGEKNFGTKLWHPRCLRSWITFILCIMCLFCLKKDLIVKIKGYLCKYDFMQGPFYSLIWVGRANIVFVEGLFVKLSVIIAWQKILLFSLKLSMWGLFWKILSFISVVVCSEGFNLTPNAVWIIVLF